MADADQPPPPPPPPIGWGVHRGTLFDLLLKAVLAAGIPVDTGVEVTGLAAANGGWTVTTTVGEAGPFDLVVGADGARSRIRRLSGLTSKDVGYPYGASWSVVPDPDRLAGDALTQRYRDANDTRDPADRDCQPCIFWSIPTRPMREAFAAGAEAWVRVARPFAGELGPLVKRAATLAVDDLATARLSSGPATGPPRRPVAR